MLDRLSIRQRILIIFIGVTCLGGAVQFIIAGRQLRSATLEFYQHHLETDALLISATFAEPLAQIFEGEGEGQVGSMLAALQQVGHDYLILDYSYRVIDAATNSGYRRGDQFPTSPEVLAAGSQRIGTDIRPNPDGADTLYLALSIQYEGSPVGYLVLFEPMQPAYDDVNQRYLELAGATLPVIALVIGASFWISNTISRPVQNLRNSALRMAKGALDTRIQVSSQDEVGQLASAFNFMASQLDALLKTQRSFVSNAAHELRTPLMTLKLRAEALAEENLSASERECYLSEIRQEIDHMAKLVSSLLMLARIDEGRHHEKGVVADPVSALHDITRNWRIEAEAKGLQFAAQIDPELPEVPMSPNDLRLVLDNLLSNAIKYTERGSVCLTAAYRQKTFSFEVRDTGLGFAPEQAAQLFERFYRSEELRGRFAGYGLGLSIVKAILDYYGGRIETTSEGIGKGASFTIRLPGS